MRDGSETIIDVDGEPARLQSGEGMRARLMRDLRAALDAGRTVRVVAQRDGSSVVVIDAGPPDPRTAHGPAWSAGTPRTADEAQAMLTQVEPRHALRDRMHHRMQRTLGNVVLEPSPRVTPGEPMPDATMARAQWREAWRDAEVPALCALRERCEASGADPVMPDGSYDGFAHCFARYPTGTARYALPTFNEQLVPLRVDERAPLADRKEVAERVSDSDEARARGNARANPLPWLPRGWCEGLAPTDLAAALRDDDPAATWQAMRAAAPERVYPEPSE